MRNEIKEKSSLRKLLKFGCFFGVIIIVFIVLSFVWSMSFKNSINPTLCKDLKEYCKQHNLDTTYCVVVDYSIYSGKDRLFLLNMSGNQVIYSSLCAHGIGKDLDCISKPKFSNEIGSNYSSLGHYKLGRQRKTTHYNLDCIELHGLDSTNSNAYARGILIHTGLPDVSILGLPCLPLSQGCFTTTKAAFMELLELRAFNDKSLMLYCSNKSVF